MRPTFAASLLAIASAIAVAAPVAAQTSAPGDFRLPPNPTPTADPNVQGPVDPDRPILTRPRAPTPTPTPAPAPRATPAPTPTPTAAATREPGTRFTPAAPSTREARPENDFTPATRAQPLDVPEDQPGEESAAPLPELPELPAAPPTTATAAPAEEEAGGFPWVWTLLGLLALLGAGAAAFFILRKREEAWAEPGAIEPPLARRTAPAADAPLAPVVPLMVEAQALTLSRSMMYATLAYELRLANRGPTPLRDIRLGGDLVTAHGRVAVDRQLADPAVPLEIIQRLEELGAGEHTVLAGQMRLPVSEIRLIPQGSAALYVPLLRLRIEAAGLAPFARTFVVGMRPSAPGGKLQPFRLDDMPQTYRQIAQRALD